MVSFVPKEIIYAALTDCTLFLLRNMFNGYRGYPSNIASLMLWSDLVKEDWMLKS